MAIYYVDADAEPGGNGSFGSPWKLAPPTGTIIAGDTVCYKLGTTGLYDRILFDWYGTSESARVLFTTYGSGSIPVITPNASAAITGWNGPVDGVYNKDIGSVTVTYVMQDLYCLKLATGLDCTDGNYYYSDPILYYKPTDGLAGHSVRHGQVNTTMYPVNAGTAGQNAYTTYENLKFVGQSATPSVAGTADYLIFSECSFIGMKVADAAALTIYGKNSYPNTGVVVDKCTFDHNYNNVYLAIGSDTSSYFDDCSITNNTITNTGLYYGDAYEHPDYIDIDGISLQNIRNTTISGNEITGVCKYHGGIHWWSETGMVASGNLIKGNFIHNVSNHGIILSGGARSGSGGSTICDNIIAHYGTGGAPLVLGSVNGGIFVGPAYSSDNPLNVFNNTLYDGETGLYLFDVNFDYVYFKNNIVDTMSSSLARAESAVKNCVLSNNCYKDGDVGTPFYASSALRSFDYWKTTWGAVETGSITDDPLFVDATPTVDTDFKLQSGSPCINAGTPVGLTTDYGGNPIIDNPDIGAWEQTTYRKVYIGGLYCNITVV